jgi:hypothetical protein
MRVHQHAGLVVLDVGVAGTCRQSRSSRDLPALGETPNGLQALIAFNRVNL